MKDLSATGMQMNILTVSYSQTHRGEVEDQKIDPT